MKRSFRIILTLGLCCILVPKIPAQTTSASSAKDSSGSSRSKSAAAAEPKPAARAVKPPKAVVNNSFANVRMEHLVARRHRTAPALLIRTGKSDPKALDQLKEDLAIMSRVLDKAVEEHSEEFHSKAAGIDILALTTGGRWGRTMHIEDYGVIFTLNVNLPLKPEPKADESGEVEPARNEEWEDARNELFGQQRTAFKFGHANRWREFRQDDVDDLKNALIEALRNAANIRNLKPTDWITVVVRGPGMEVAETMIADVYTAYGEVLSSADAGGADSTMVLRVRKSDVDKAGSGKERGDFAKNVSVAVY